MPKLQWVSQSLKRTIWINHNQSKSIVQFHMTWLFSPRTLVRGRDERLCRVRALYRPWRHTTQVSYPGEFPRDFPSGPSGHSVCYREWTILVCRFKDHYLVQRDIFAISKIKECRTKNISHCDLGINICLSVVIRKIKIGADNRSRKSRAWEESGTSKLVRVKLETEGK